LPNVQGCDATAEDEQPAAGCMINLSPFKIFPLLVRLFCQMADDDDLNG